MTQRDIFDFGVGRLEPVERIIRLLAADGNYCLIGGLALNCYVDPVFTADVDFAIAGTGKTALQQRLANEGIRYKEINYDMSVFIPNSKLTVHVTFDEQYSVFPARAEAKMLFDEIPVKVASLDDLITGKTLAWQDSCRKLSKRQKDKLDLIRIGEAYPDKIPLLPVEIQQEMQPDMGM